MPLDPDGGCSIVASPGEQAPRNGQKFVDKLGPLRIEGLNRISCPLHSVVSKISDAEEFQMLITSSPSVTDACMNILEAEKRSGGSK